MSRDRSWVEASTTHAAAPSWCARSQLAAVKPHRAPGTSPGNSTRAQACSGHCRRDAVARELRGHRCADRMTSAVLGAGAAAPVAIEAGEGVEAAGFELLAHEYVVAPRPHIAPSRRLFFRSALPYSRKRDVRPEKPQVSEPLAGRRGAGGKESDCSRSRRAKASLTWSRSRRVDRARAKSTRTPTTATRPARDPAANSNVRTCPLWRVRRSEVERLWSTRVTPMRSR